MSGLAPLLGLLLQRLPERQAFAAFGPSTPAGSQPVQALPAPAPLSGDAAPADIDTSPALPLRPGAAAPAGLLTPGTAGATVRLSSAADQIAALLARPAAGEPAIRPVLPLLPGPAAAPAVLAAALRDSVAGSGLFYESHLADWYHGRLPQAVLDREPQMRVPPAVLPHPSASRAASLRLNGPTPGPASAQAAAAAAGSALAAGAADRTATSQSPLQAVLSPMPAAPQGPLTYLATPLAKSIPAAASSSPAPAGPLAAGTAPEGNAAASSPSASAEPSRSTERGATLSEPGKAELGAALARESAERGGTAPGREAEALQDLVQSQLHLLAAPVLRWEGDVWAGLFLALAILPPADEERAQSEGEAQEDDEAWRSDFTLRAGELGALRVKVLLRGKDLELELRAESGSALARLEAGREGLMKRLRASGFPEARLRMQRAEAVHD